MGPISTRGLPIGFAALLLLVAGSSTARAQSSVWVDDSNCPGPGSGTPGDPYCRIQDAICIHRNDPGGVVVNVLPGSYNEAVRMFPSVDLVSTDGPDVTFIDPTGKACFLSSCTVGTLIPCSGVYFPTGASGRLEGFTVHNGRGLRQTCSGTCDIQIGGGITVFGSAPTITRNTIEENVVLSAGSSTKTFNGGGIYVNGTDNDPAQPVITRNLIRSNDVNPTGGSQGQPTFAFGGGIYAGFNSAPTIVENTIESNSSGDGSANQFAAGAGIAVYSGWLGTTAIVQRNLVKLNDASDWGGGILLGESNPNNDAVIDPSLATVESNVVVENVSYDGGGLYAATSLAAVRNNTIADNVAAVRGTDGGHGGGIYASPPGTGSVAQATFSNNVVAFNEAHVGPDGGGLGGGVYFPTVAANPTLQSTDLYGNTPTNVGGVKVDGDYIGQDGNVSIDPDFVSRTVGARDYHLLQGSPLIDAGDPAAAAPIDADGAPRPQDGDDNGTILPDIGAYEYSPDYDGDGAPDWEDADDDDDGVLDASDCAARSKGVSSLPAAVGNTLRLDRTSGGRLFWLRSPQGHTYNVYRGNLQRPWIYDEGCLVTETPALQIIDAANPAPGSGYYYLVGARNLCGDSPIGKDSLGQDRGPAFACSALGADSDGDTAIDVADNCASVVNPVQGDIDGDWVGDGCDNCGLAGNADQADTDGDGPGDVCDNCASIVNPAQTDTDLDTMGDLCDPDDDNDGFDDGVDCAPLDAGTFAPPVEVSGVSFPAAPSTDLAWSAQGSAVYDVVAGDVGVLRASGSVSAAECLASDLAPASWTDPRPDPVPGAGGYYLVRARNVCGQGTYGTASSGAPRIPSAPCP